MKKITIISVIFILVSFSLSGQHIDGIWKGWSEKKILVFDPSLINLELSKVDDSTYIGVLHNYYKRGRFEHIKINGKYNELTGDITLSEDSLISYKFDFADLCLGVSTLKLVKTDSSLLMTGIWKDKNKRLLHCPNMNIKFEKLYSAVQKVNKARIEDVQKVIDIERSNADSIRIDLYDNGIVDDDSVSVILNDLIILQNVKLLAAPQTLYFNLDKNLGINKLIVFAINEGSIPPNTAYIVITTKNHRYQLNLSSSKIKNGVLEFQFID